jgi:ankyrin repeat protein
MYLDLYYFIVPPGHYEAVRLLLSKGVPVDPVDHRGTPLHLAASNDHVEVVKVLLEHSADVSCLIPSSPNWTGNADTIKWAWLDDVMVYSWRCIRIDGGFV